MDSMFDDNDIFGDIEIATSRPPIDGVPEAAYPPAVSWSTKTLAAIGLPSARGRTGWMEDLTSSTTLEAIRNRTERPRTEHLVSQEIDGQLRTGVDGLDHSELVRELEDQGYTITQSTTLFAVTNDTEFLIERFDR
jgi:hypothetical protein